MLQIKTLFFVYRLQLKVSALARHAAISSAFVKALLLKALLKALESTSQECLVSGIRPGFSNALRFQLKLPST